MPFPGGGGSSAPSTGAFELGNREFLRDVAVAGAGSVVTR
jgi:hypothetical protein